MTCKTSASCGRGDSDGSHSAFAKQWQQMQIMQQYAAMQKAGTLGIGSSGLTPAPFGLGQAPKQAPTNLTTGNTWGSWLKGLLP